MHGNGQPAHFADADHVESMLILFNGILGTNQQISK